MLRRFLLTVLPFAIAFLAGCSVSKTPTEQERIKQMQASAFLGSTEKWNLSGEWRISMGEMRDRAYRFCITRHSEDRTCADRQDFSLHAAMNADATADAAKSGKVDKEDAIAFSLHLEPKLYEDARKYCFSVYEDAGSEDARALGPCLSNATGSDFFGIRGVPSKPH
jgi:hypothetical protein